MYHDHTVSIAERTNIAAMPPVHAPENHPFQSQLWQEAAGLQRHAVHLARDWHRAQDLVQETLVKAWANRARYIAGTNLRAWLHTILRNAFLSDIRKRRREVEDVDGSLTAQLSEPPSQDHAVALSELLLSIAHLPPPQREALMLVGAEGYSILEAADRLGCATGTVKSRVSRARSTLTARLLSEPACNDTCLPRRRPVIKPALSASTAEAARHDQDRSRQNRPVSQGRRSCRTSHGLSET